MAAIMAHMLRIFFTGAYRKPREFNWLIGIVLFTLGMLEGLFGYSLPDDLLSGAGLRILEGVIISIPIVGTYLSFFLFGGQFPGDVIIPRLYILHVLVIPGLILALVSAHLFLMIWQKHTQMPGKGRTNQNVVGQPMYPYFMAKTGAFFFFVFGFCALLATFAQINPIWIYGPFTPSSISAGSQPDFYMGMLEGALRVWPSWSWNVAGHTFAFNVFLPALVPLGLIFTGAAFWPFIERWATGDQSFHNINDRPRNAPTRTAVGLAAVAFYGILLLEGANDLIANYFSIPLYTVTWIARFAFILGPILAYVITKRVCIGLQHKDRELLTHGLETGIIRQTPEGGFVEIERPVSEEARAVLTSKTELPRLPDPDEEDENGVPAPAVRGATGKVRARLNRAFTESIPLASGDGHGDGDGDGDGHGNGHAVEGEPEHAAIGAPPPDHSS
jgi:ubiquinol-cytochrome c reductase cytochrome b subunit